MPNNPSVPLLACALMCSGLTTQADPPAPRSSTARAREFVVRFTGGTHAENVSGMTAEMQAAAGPGPSEQLRSALLAQYGAVREVGEAWLEDRMQGLERFRVPVQFEGQSIDFRVVLDGSGLVAGFFLVAHVERPEESAAPPFRQIDVGVGEDETALPGTLTLPEGPGPFPAAVLVHGSGPNDRDETIGPNRPFRELAWELAERGVATLRYDKRSYARPADLAAAGDALTVRQEVIDDARLALQALRGRKEIDAARLFVVGHSLGGTLLPRIAEAEPRPAGLIALAGATLPLPEKILSQTRYIVALDGTVTPEEQGHLDRIATEVHTLRAAMNDTAAAPPGPILGLPLGYYRDLEAHDPPADAARLGLPILVLQGKRDYQVTIEDFERWKLALAGKGFACLVAYDDLDHLFRSGSGPSGPSDYERGAPVDPRPIDDIAGWIKARRCPNAPAARP